MQIAIILREHVSIYIFRETTCGVKYTVERSEQTELLLPLHAHNAAYPPMIGSPKAKDPMYMTYGPQIDKCSEWNIYDCI